MSGAEGSWKSYGVVQEVNCAHIFGQAKKLDIKKED
jgi:hypothetical protein